MKVVAILALALAVAIAQPVGIAVLRGTAQDPTILGTVIFRLNSLNNSNIDVEVSISGITQNLGVEHGFHVHMWGDISDQQTGLATGPHWSISGEVHSCPPNETRHSGDMGNWMVYSNGTLTGTKTFDKLALNGVNSIIGRGVILHNLTDDCTGTNGNAGARLAQGVIGIMNTTNNTASNGLPRTTTGTDYAICNLFAIQNTEPITGYGIVSQGATGGINVIVQIANQNANAVHAVHIHNNGDLRDGASLGGHWNPVANRHGMYGWPNHHTGDLGNIIYYQNAQNTTAAGNFSQDSASFNVVGGAYNVIGHGMVVHANRDDCTDPIGNSGARYATCVWGISNGNFSWFAPAPPAAGTVSTAYDITTQLACNASFAGFTTTTTTSTSSTTGSSTSTTGEVVTTANAVMVAASALAIFVALLI